MTTRDLDDDIKIGGVLNNPSSAERPFTSDAANNYYNAVMTRCILKTPGNEKKKGFMGKLKRRKSKKQKEDECMVPMDAIDECSNEVDDASTIANSKTSNYGKMGSGKSMGASEDKGSSRNESSDDSGDKNHESNNVTVESDYPCRKTSLKQLAAKVMPVPNSRNFHCHDSLNVNAVYDDDNGNSANKKILQSLQNQLPISKSQNSIGDIIDSKKTKKSKSSAENEVDGNRTQDNDRGMKTSSPNAVSVEISTENAASPNDLKQIISESLDMRSEAASEDKNASTEPSSQPLSQPNGEHGNDGLQEASSKESSEHSTKSNNSTWSKASVKSKRSIKSAKSKDGKVASPIGSVISTKFNTVVNSNKIGLGDSEVVLQAAHSIDWCDWSTKSNRSARSNATLKSKKSQGAVKPVNSQDGQAPRSSDSVRSIKSNNTDSSEKFGTGNGEDVLQAACSKDSSDRSVKSNRSARSSLSNASNKSKGSVEFVKSGAHDHASTLHDLSSVRSANSNTSDKKNLENESANIDGPKKRVLAQLIPKALPVSRGRIDYVVTERNDGIVHDNTSNPGSKAFTDANAEVTNKEVVSGNDRSAGSSVSITLKKSKGSIELVKSRSRDQASSLHDIAFVHSSVSTISDNKKIENESTIRDEQKNVLAHLISKAPPVSKNRIDNGIHERNDGSIDGSVSNEAVKAAIDAEVVSDNDRSAKSRASNSHKKLIVSVEFGKHTAYDQASSLHDVTSVHSIKSNTSDKQNLENESAREDAPKTNVLTQLMSKALPVHKSRIDDGATKQNDGNVYGDESLAGSKAGTNANAEASSKEVVSDNGYFKAVISCDASNGSTEIELNSTSEENVKPESGSKKNDAAKKSLKKLVSDRLSFTKKRGHDTNKEASSKLKYKGSNGDGADVGFSTDVNNQRIARKAASKAWSKASGEGSKKNDGSGAVSRKNLKQLLSEALASSQTPEEIAQYLIDNGGNSVINEFLLATEKVGGKKSAKIYGKEETGGSTSSKMDIPPVTSFERPGVVSAASSMTRDSYAPECSVDTSISFKEGGNNSKNHSEDASAIKRSLSMISAVSDILKNSIKTKDDDNCNPARVEEDEAALEDNANTKSSDSSTAALSNPSSAEDSCKEEAGNNTADSAEVSSEKRYPRKSMLTFIKDKFKHSEEGESAKMTNATSDSVNATDLAEELDLSVFANDKDEVDSEKKGCSGDLSIAVLTVAETTKGGDETEESHKRYAAEEWAPQNVYNLDTQREIEPSTDNFACTVDPLGMTQDFVSDLKDAVSSVKRMFRIFPTASIDSNDEGVEALLGDNKDDSTVITWKDLKVRQHS